MAQGDQYARNSGNSVQYASQNYPPKKQGAEVLIPQFLSIVSPEGSIHSPALACSGRVGSGGERRLQAEKHKC